VFQTHLFFVVVIKLMKRVDQKFFTDTCINLVLVVTQDCQNIGACMATKFCKELGDWEKFVLKCT